MSGRARSPEVAWPATWTAAHTPMQFEVAGAGRALVRVLVESEGAEQRHTEAGRLAQAGAALDLLLDLLSDARASSPRLAVVAGAVLAGGPPSSSGLHLVGPDAQHRPRVICSLVRADLGPVDGWEALTAACAGRRPFVAERRPVLEGLRDLAVVLRAGRRPPPSRLAPVESPLAPRGGPKVAA